jgi:hypothetical protein
MLFSAADASAPTTARRGSGAIRNSRVATAGGDQRREMRDAELSATLEFPGQLKRQARMLGTNEGNAASCGG